jgi:hypothetical protein
MKFDKVLSFNYTDTYRKIYNTNSQEVKYDFIHGKANTLNGIETNNMVLGIDEYLDDELRNKETTFIEFKKYYQRIHKKTGCAYKDWLTKIKNIDSTEKHEIYIFGHSLDITDKDVIRELIDNENVKTTIYYFNRDTYGNQIANLVKVLGQDNLISKVYGDEKIITFKEQKTMIQLKETEFEIRLDIGKLHNLYDLTNQERSILIDKIKKNIAMKNIEYFKNQDNVISIYDELVWLEEGEPEIESKLFEIAEELVEIDPECEPIKFNYEDWARIDYTEIDECNEKTIEFISCLNESNRKKYEETKPLQIDDIINSNDLNLLYKFLSNYYINDKCILYKIMYMILEKFNESGTVAKQIWTCIRKIIDITEISIFEEYIEKEKNNATQLVIRSRLIHMQEIFEEKKFKHSLEEIAPGEN